MPTNAGRCCRFQVWRLALEVLRQPDRVAQQRHPLGRSAATPAAEVLGLLQRQHRLAAARSPAHLDAAQQPGDLEDHHLLLGQPIRLGRARLRVGVDVVRRVVPPGEDLADELDVVMVGRGVVVRQPPAVGAGPFGEVDLLVLVVQRPARQVGDGEVVAEHAVRRHHAVRPRHVSPPSPARVRLDVAADRVLGVARLVDRPAAVVLLPAADPPAALVVPDRPALDLEHQDARLGHQHHQVGLVVLVLVGEADVGHDDAVRTQPVPQSFPHLTLRAGGERGVLWEPSLPW